MSETRTLKVIVVGNAKQASTVLKGLSNDADNSGKRVQSMGSKMGAAFLKIGKVAAVGFGVAAVAAGAFLYKVGAPYEQTLNKIQVLNNASAKSMDKVKDRLAESSGLYAKMGQTVGDAATGVVELSKSGLDLNKSMNAVNATMILAKAGEMEVAEASELVANTLNTFSMKAKEAGDIANYLANAANISSVDVKDVGHSLAYVAPVAAKTGLALEQTTAMIAMLGNEGIKGSSAGTGLRKVLMSLQAPSGAGAKALKDMGAEIFTAQGKMKPFGKILDEMNAGMSKFTEEEKAVAMKDIFGLTGITSGQILLKNGSEGLKSYTKDVKRAGAAEKLAQSASKGLSGTIASLKAGFVSAGQVIYIALAPIVNKALKPIADAMGKINFDKVAKGVSSLFSGGGGKGGEAFAKTFAAIRKAGSELLPVIVSFGNKLKAIVGPAIKSIGGMITKDFLPAFQKFLPVVTPIAKFLLEIFGGAVLGVIKGVVNVVKGVINVITGIIKVFTGLLTGNWSQAWEGVKQIVGGVLQAIWGAIQVWWNIGILSIFKKGIVKLLSLWKGGWATVKGLFAKGVGAIGNVLSKVIQIITWPHRKAFSILKNYVTTGWQYIKGAFGKGVGGIKGVLSRVIEVITWPHRQAFNILKNLITNAWSIARSLFTRGVNGIKTIIGRVKGIVTGAFSSAGTWLTQAGKNVVQGLVNGLDAAKQWIVDKIASLTAMIPDKFKKLMGIASPSKVMRNLASFIPQGIAQGLRDNPSLAKIKSSMEYISEKIRNAFGRKEITASNKDALLKALAAKRASYMKAAGKTVESANKLNKAKDKLEAARKSLATVVDARKGLVASAKDASMSYGSLMGTWGSGEAGERNYASHLLLRFQKRLEGIRAFKTNLAQLAKAGLSNSMLNEIVGAGPDAGGAMAAALMADSGLISAFNAVSKGIDTESTAIGNQAGDRTFKTQIKAEQRKVNRAQQNVVNIRVEVKGNVTTERDLAKSIAGQVRDEIARKDKRAGKKQG